MEDCRLRCLRTRPDSSLFYTPPSCSSPCVCIFLFLTHVRHVNFYFLLISLSDFFFFFAQAFFGYVFALSPFLPVALSLPPCLSCLCLAIVWVLFWVLCLSRGLCLFCLLLIWRAYVGSAFFAFASPPCRRRLGFLSDFYLSKNEKTHTQSEAEMRRRMGDHSCKGGFNVALICGNRALNVAIFEVKLLELFDAMRCETRRGNEGRRRGVSRRERETTPDNENPVATATAAALVPVRLPACLPCQGAPCVSRACCPSCFTGCK